MPKNQIYDFLKANNLTTKDEATFQKEYSDPQKAAELHKFLQENKLTTKSKEEFYQTYFEPQVKKKEPTPSSGQQGGSPSPSASKPSNPAVPQGQAQPVKPTSAWQAAKPATPLPAQAKAQAQPAATSKTQAYQPISVPAIQGVDVGKESTVAGNAQDKKMATKAVEQDKQIQAAIQQPNPVEAIPKMENNPYRLDVVEQIKKQRPEVFDNLTFDDYVAIQAKQSNPKAIVNEGQTKFDKSENYQKEQALLKDYSGALNQRRVELEQQIEKATGQPLYQSMNALSFLNAQALRLSDDISKLSPVIEAYNAEIQAINELTDPNAQRQQLDALNQKYEGQINQYNELYQQLKDIEGQTQSVTQTPEFVAYEQINSKLREAAKKYNNLEFEDKYKDIFEEKRAAQAASDEAYERGSFEDKMNIALDPARKTGAKMAKGAIGLVSSMLDDTALNQIIDFNRLYDKADFYIDDWYDRLVPTPSQLKTPTFVTYSNVDGYRVMLDENKKPIEVRDKNYRPVSEEIAIEVLNKYIPNSRDYGIVEDTNIGAFFSNVASTMTDMYAAIQTGSGLARVTGLATPSVIAAYSTQMFDDFRDEAISRGMNKNAANDYAAGMSVLLSSIETVISPIERRIAAGQKSLFGTGKLTKEIVDLINTGKMSTKEAVKKISQTYLKDVGSELSQELFFEPAAQNVGNAMANQLTGSTLETNNFQQGKQALETALITGLVTSVFSGVNIKAEYDSQMGNMFKTAFDNPAVYEQIMNDKLALGGITQETYDANLKNYKEAQKGYDYIKKTVQDEDKQKELTALYVSKLQAENSAASAITKEQKEAYKLRAEGFDKKINDIINKNAIDEDVPKVEITPTEQAETAEVVTPEEVVVEAEKVAETEPVEVVEDIEAKPVEQPTEPNISGLKNVSIERGEPSVQPSVEPIGQVAAATPQAAQPIETKEVDVAQQAKEKEDKLHNDLVDLRNSYNALSPAKKNQAAGKQKLSQATELAKRLGYEIGYADRKLTVTGANGKPIGKRSQKEVIEDVSQEQIDYAKGEISKGILIWGGGIDEPRIDLGISRADVVKGEQDIRAGKTNTIPAKRLINAINAQKEKGEYKLIYGSGGGIAVQYVPLSEFNELTTGFTEAEEKIIEESQDQLAKEFDEWFTSMSPEEQETFLNEVYGEETADDTGEVVENPESRESKDDVRQEEKGAAEEQQKQEVEPVAVEKTATGIGDAKTPNVSNNIQTTEKTTSFDKAISASSRFRPYETIVFEKPIVGENGNKLISYQWAYEWTMQPSKSDTELKSKRISDWTQAENSAETGRDIVHKFTVEKKDGTIVTVSSETIPSLLGYVDAKQMKNLPSVVSSIKTLAKQKMQLAILEAQEKEYNELKEKYTKAKKPEIEAVKMTEENAPLALKRAVREGDISRTMFKMGDVSTTQENPHTYNSATGKVVFSENNKPSKSTTEYLESDWVQARIKEDGGIYPRGIYDLRRRVERQERKVEQATGSKIKTAEQSKQEVEVAPSSVDKGQVGEGQKPSPASNEKKEAKPKEPTTIKPTSEKELTNAMEKVFGLKKPIAKRVSKVIAQSAKGLIKAGVFADEKAFWDAFPTLSDEKVSEITEAQQQGAKGMYRAAINFINALTNPDLSTPLHEVSHWWLTVLDASANSGNKEAKRMLDAFDVFAKSGEGQKFWNKNFTGKFNPSNYKFRQELFARSWEKYLYDGVVPQSLKKLFDGFMDFMKEIYKDLTDINIQLSPNMLVLFNGIMGEDMRFDQVPAETVDIAVDELSDVLNELEGLFQEPSNKKEEDGYDIKRLRKAEEQGRISSGEINEIATTVLSRLHEAVGEKYGTNSSQYTRIVNEEEAFLEDLSKEGGFWVDDADKQYGDYYSNGQENVVYINPKNTSEVVKLNNGGLDPNWLEFLDRVALHNAYFPSTAYTVEGFGKTSKGEFVAILKQPFIQANAPTSQEINDYMTQRGFERLSKYDDSIIGTVEEDRSFIDKKNGIIVEDLHLGNVMKGEDGNMFVIDPVISLDTPDRGYGGTRTPNEGQEDTTLFQESQSNNAKSKLEDSLTAAAEKAVQSGLSKKDFIAKLKSAATAEKLFKVISEKEVGKIFDKVVKGQPTDNIEEVVNSIVEDTGLGTSPRRYIARGIDHYADQAYRAALQALGAVQKTVKQKLIEPIADKRFREMLASGDPAAAFTAFVHEATKFNPDAMMAGDDFVDAQSTADAMIFHKIIHYYQAQDNLEQWKYWTDVFARIGTRYGRFISAMQEAATPEAIANKKIEEIQAKRNEKLNEKQSDGRTGKEIVEDVKENVKTTKDEAQAVTAGGKATGKAKSKAAKNINSNKPKPIRITALSSKEKQEKAASAKSRLDKYKGYLKAKGLLQSPYTATKEMMDELSAMMDDVIGMGAKNKEEAMATFMDLLEGIGIKEADAQEVFDEIWDDATHGEAVKKEFSDYLANRVANVAVTQTKAKKPITDPIELLARALISKVSEIIPDATKARVKADSKKTSPYAKLAELIKNGKISEQAWRDAMKEVEERIKARTDMSAEEKSSMIAMMEDTVSNFLTEPLPKALVRQAVKQGMKDADIVLDEVIQQSLTEQDNTGRTLAQKIIDATGLDVATAIELQDAVIADWNEMLGAKKRQRIAEILGVQEDGSPRAVKERKNTKKPSTVDKIMEAISLGVFDGDTFTDAFAEKFGFTKFTGKEIAKLVDFAQQIRALGAVGEIQQRNRIISQMANYIASMDKFMAYRFFDFLSNFDYANIFTSVGTIKNIVVGSALANWTQRIPEFAGNVGWTVEKAVRGTGKKAVFEGGKARQEFNKAFKGTGLKGGSVGAFFEVLKTGFNQIDNIESVYEDKAGQGNEFRYIADNRKALFKEAMQEKNPLKRVASVMAIGKSLANYGSNFASAFDTLFTFRGVEREAWAQAWREEVKKVNPDAYNYEQILNAVKKRVGYDAIQLAEAERKTDEAIAALQSMGIKLPFGYKKQELRNQLAALRERELTEFATQAAQSANLLGKPTGLTGKAYEAISRSRRFQYSNTNDLVGGWIGNLAKFTLKHSILMFLRISAKSMNVSLASIPVLGVVPNVVEFKPTTKTTTTMIGGREVKKTEEVWQTALRSRESFNKILGVNAVATTVLLGAFAMMFRYNDDDEEYELDPDRMLDITLNQENVTGQKGGKYSDLGYTPLSIRFKKDGEWMPWMTYKYATPLVSSLSILGGIRDRNTYRLKDEQEQPTGVVGDGEESASNLKQKGLGDQTFGDAMSDILSAQTELSFNQNMRLVQSIAEAFKKGQEGKSADYAVADITAQSTKAFRLSLPLTGNYANTAAGLIYDLTDVSNKKISVWQGVMQKNTAYEDLDIMGWIAEAVSDEPNVSGKQPFLDKYGYEVPRENALELLASSVPIVDYKQPAIRELITKPPYELKIKYPGMYVPPKYSATASTKIGKAIKEQDLPFAAKQSVENLVAQEWGKIMETAKVEDPEFNNMSEGEAEEFLQWTRAVATENITGQGSVTVKTSDGYTDNVTIEAYGLYKANPKLYFKIFPDVKQLNIVE